MAHYHVYSLSKELLQTLSPRNLLSIHTNPVFSGDPAIEPVILASSPKAAMTCNVCLSVGFGDLQEQRVHFRSDWHRYNVKIRLNGGNPVSEPAFSLLIEALDDSLSGSESSYDEKDADFSDVVNDLVNKSGSCQFPSSPFDNSENFGPRTALFWFHSPPSTQIGIYRAIFPDPNNPSTFLAALNRMNTPLFDGRKWALFMVSGGHFAGAIVCVSRPGGADHDNKKGITTMANGHKKIWSDVEVLRHKTFHRYTTRRKQGGSQCTNDSSKGSAKSAGALLRRYGERALRDDIQGLLSEWRDDIHGCERIWLRSNHSNRKIFVDFDSAIIAKGDQRLRTFPFPTRRPTQSEISRCLQELIKVKISHLTEDELRIQDEAYLSSLPKLKPIVDTTAERERPKQPQLTIEEVTERDRWSRLIEMVSKGRLDSLKHFWDREGSYIGSIDSLIPEWAGERSGTILQLASQAGHAHITQWLLKDLHADPTIPVPSLIIGEDHGFFDDDKQSDESDNPKSFVRCSHRTAYDLARVKIVRDVFRRAAAAHPDWWDWFGAARVPSALSKQMEDDHEVKKRARRKGLKDRLKEREGKERVAKERERKEQEMDRKDLPIFGFSSQSNSEILTAHRLGGTSGDTDSIIGLTLEMRAKIERERRARAAEARIKALSRE